MSLNYEPGSTFKAITVAGALQDGLITPNTEFNIPPQLQIADRTIHDAENHPAETLTTAGILRVSSNIGADEIGLKLGAKRFDYWVRRFGFGSKTGVDLPGEQSGIVLHWWQYSGSTMANVPFGQGESVTPMQMVAAYSTIANGGILRTPHIVGSVGDKSVPVPAGRRIISATTASELRDMLRGVFADGGTASGAAIPGYDMAGKTGTANVAVHGTYSDSLYVASFIGMVPTNSPQARDRGGRRRTARLDLRWIGGRSGVPEDRRLGGAVLRDQPVPVAMLTGAEHKRRRAGARRRPVTRLGHRPRERRRISASELPAEPGQPLVPLPPDLRHPRDRVRKRFWGHPVAHLTPGALPTQQTGVGQRAEVLEHRLTGNRQLGRQLGGRDRRLGGDRGQ